MSSPGDRCELTLVADDTQRAFRVDRAACVRCVDVVRLALEADPAATTFRAGMPPERVLETIVAWVQLCARHPYLESGDAAPLRVHQLAPDAHVRFLLAAMAKDALWVDRDLMPACDRMWVSHLASLYVLVMAVFVRNLSLDVVAALHEDDAAFARHVGAFIRTVHV